MSTPLQDSYLQGLASDTRHFLRSPGLAAVTFTAVILILLFIVFPIGSVLVRSFSVTYPTVTVRSKGTVSSSADYQELVIRPILAALKPIEGIEETRTTLQEGQPAVSLRFRKDWDDLRALNDVKRAVKKLFDEVAPRYETRQGGYSRVLKVGTRKGDAAPMSILELVERKVKKAPKPDAAKKKGRKKKKAEAEEAPAEE